MARKQILFLVLLLWSIAVAAQHEHHQQPAPAQQPAGQQPKADPHAGHQQPAPQQPATDLHAGHKMRPAAPQERPVQPVAETEVPTNRRLLKLGATAAERALTLDELLRRAEQRNPTLKQAAAEIEAARGRRRQAGLWPNPSVGYAGEEIRGGSSRGGQHGAFVEQSVLLGGKLRAGQQVAQQDIRIAEIEAEEQRMRVTNAVRMGYFRALAAQELVRARREMSALASDSLATAKRLQNLGQLDESEVLQAEVEKRRADLNLLHAQNELRQVWTALTAVTGEVSVQPRPLAGRLDERLPQLDEEAVTQRLTTESPAVRIAQAVTERSEAQVTQARRQAVPDMTFRGGLQQNRELLDGTNRAVGLQGFAEVGIQLPIFNRNQGNVAAARAAAERSRSEQERVRLLLQERLAGVLQGYRDAQQSVTAYREQILPSAEKAYEMMFRQWGRMAASYPTLLMAQRSYFESFVEYIQALEQLHTTAIAAEGLLLTDGLEAPTGPEDVEIQIREVNAPRGDGGER